MNCFPCFSSQKSKKSASKNDRASNDDDVNASRLPEPTRHKQNTENNDGINQTENGNTSVKTFTFRELATATKNFRQECLLGEGGSGRVYKATFQSTGQEVAVKQLDKHGLHANKEFQAEVSALSQLGHPNLVKLIGYCADGDQRLLVYDFVSGGSLQDHLLDMKPNQQPMDWITRMKIAYGAAQGLEYLHDKVNPPVIYRDLKASNILLDGEFSPKLSDFGLHKLGPGTGDKMPLSSRVMGTYGYCAPEYARGRSPTIKSDVYSFGVVLLELITGRRAVDTTKPGDEQNLVAWAQPIFRDPKKYPDMADPLLKKKFPERGLNQAVAIASMCLQEEAAARPLISDVMVALSFLSMSTEDGIPTAVPILSFRDKSMSIALSRHASCTPAPHPPPDTAMKENSSGLHEKSSVNNEKIHSDKNDQDEGSATDSDDGSDPDSYGNQEENEEASHFGKSGKSNFNLSFGSERRSADDGNEASSLKSNCSISSEEEIEGLSRKNSRKSNEESTSSRYDSGRDDSLRNVSGRTSSRVLKDDENAQLGHSRSSKSDNQSVSSDDSDDDSGFSHRKKSEGRVTSPEH